MFATGETVGLAEWILVTPVLCTLFLIICTKINSEKFTQLRRSVESYNVSFLAFLDIILHIRCVQENKFCHCSTYPDTLKI